MLLESQVEDLTTPIVRRCLPRQ